MIRKALIVTALLPGAALAAPYAGSCFPDRTLPPPAPAYPQAISVYVDLDAGFGTSPYYVTVYRQPCPGAGSAALVNFHALGAPAGRFPKINITQAGRAFTNVPYSRAPFANGEGVYPDFEPLGTGSPVVLDAESVDYDASFTLAVQGSTTVTVDVPAYDESLYSAAAGPVPVASYVSGTYFDTATPGEGMQITVDPSETIVVAWYTFTADGEPLWLAGAGPVCPELVCVTAPQYTRVDLYAQRGGGFAGGFNPANVQGTKWGSVRLEWAACDKLEIELDQTHSDASLPSADGVRNWIKLTGVAGAECN